MPLQEVVSKWPHGYVVYNQQEYQYSYGHPNGLALQDTRCLVWIFRPTACNHVEGYCSQFRGCNQCVVNDGCGFCRNRSSDTGSGHCQAGSKTSNMLFEGSQEGCREWPQSQPTEWLFGGPLFRRSHSGEAEVCAQVQATPEDGSAWEVPVAREPELVQAEAAAPSLWFPWVVGAMVLVLVPMMMLPWMRRRCPGRQDQRANIGVNLEVNVIGGGMGQGVDLEALERAIPSCRPCIIGRSSADGEAGHDGDAVPCSVCLADLQVGDEARVLPCGHKYHRACIDHWLAKCSACPLCRSQVLQVPPAIAPTAAEVMQVPPGIAPTAAELPRPTATPGGSGALPVAATADVPVAQLDAEPLPATES